MSVPSRALIVVLLLTAPAVSPASAQQTLTWDANAATAGTGGTGTWDTTGLLWFNGVTFQTWNNGTFDDAIFGGTVGTVTLGVPVSVRNLTFATNAYSLTGSSLSFGGTTPTITTNPGVTATIGSAIQGSANIVKTGTGTLVLSGANTYSGLTTISAGTLQVGSAGTAGTLGTGGVVNNAALTFNRTDTLTVANVVSGTGTMFQNGTGTTILTGANTYTGVTTINNGVLQIGDGGTTGSIVGNVIVTSGEELAFNRSDTLTYAGAISGSSGDLLQIGTGTTILTGTNTYTGGTAISAGTLQIGNGGTAGSIVGNVVTSGSGRLAFERSDAVTFAGVISGTGTLSQLGSGTLTLTGANTFTGGTTISAGTLQIGSGGTTGTIGSGAVQNDAALVFNRSTALTVAGAISGTGTVTKLGAGTTTLTGANSYSGLTTISAGTLQVGSGGTVGTLGTGVVVNNATLSFNRSNTLTVANAISGTGSLVQAGSGTTILTGTNTYSGGTTISGGTLQLGNGGTTGSLVGNVSATTGEALAFNRSDIVTFAGIMSGAGILRQIGAGTTILTGTNTYTGGTTVTAGTLQIGDGGTTGSIVGNVATSGALVVNRSDAVTLAGVVSGTGTLSQLGSGTLTLTGTNTYTGGTTISAGTLQVGSGGTTGTLGPGAVQNDAALIFNRSNALTVASAIGGTGTVTKLGAGTTTLTGANTYSGVTTISAGTLQVGSGTTGTLGAGAVVNDATLSFNRSNGLTVANVVSGAGSVVQNGTGTTILTGANTYTGGTTINNGRLQIGDGGTAGSIVGDVNVTTDEELAFNRSDTITFGGVISGIDGDLFQIGTGTTILTGTNTYTGGTTISAGTLQIGDGGTAGSIVGSVATSGSGRLAFDRADAVTFAGVVSGTGTLSQVGGGTLALTGTNTYTGGTTISAGTLQIGSGGTTGALGPGAVQNDAALVFNRSNALTVASGIGGAGTVTQLGAGTTSLTGANTYSGVTTISAGTLQVGSGGTVGTLGTGAVVNGATLSFNRSNGLTVANVVSGAGSVVQNGNGTTILTGANTYTGGTTINNGRLQIGDGGTTGSIAGNVNVTTGEELAFNRSDTITFAGVISGVDGDLFQIGTGTTILTGANTYTGGTTISAGTLQIGDGGTAGSIVGSVATSGSGRLVFDRSDAVTFAGVVSGTGTLSQLGGGPLTLTGTNTYTGGTTISAGALQIGSGGTTGTLGPGAVQNDAALLFNRSNALTVASAIGGAGTVTQLGAGTTSLTGANTYSGVTTISAGTLQVGSGTTGTLGTGAVVNDATLSFNRSNGLAVANVVSGTGSVVQNGTGTTILTGANTYTGGTTINNGRLQIGDGGTTGSIVGDVNVTTDEELAFNRSDTITFGGVISGIDGDLFQIGTGTTILTGTNTYTGGTTVSAGTLQIGDGGTAGSIGGDVLTSGSGRLAFDRSDAVTFAGVVSGTGTLSQLGGGTLTLTGTNTYTGGTTVSAGTLQIGDGATTGTLGSGEVVNDATLAFNRSDVLTVTGAVSGTGSVTQGGAGTTALTGANTYTGGTTISAGTLQLGDGGTTGSVLGDVTNAGTLVFNRSDAATFGGVVSGTGTLTQFGSGTTRLTGASTYTGGTTIAAGTLQLGDGGTTGSILGDVLNQGTLAFNRADDVTFGGVISGAGGVVKAGPGALVLTGASTYAGPTVVESGALLVNGSLGSTAVSVGIGATLGGVGSIAGSVALDSGARLSPGVSLGTLTLGSLSLANGSMLDYELSAPVGVNDLVVVGGDLTLDGVLNVADAGGFGVGAYTLMTYGGGLTNQGLQFGLLPGGFGYAYDAGGGLVRLLVTAPVDGAVQYWDGTGPSANGVANGGSGVWTAGIANWTSATGVVHTTWQGQRAAFGGDAGTVAVQGVVEFSDLRFERDGYTIAALPGGLLTVAESQATIGVGAGAVATVSAPIAGTGGLVKEDGGTLILTGANQYSGGTTISGGVLQGNTTSLSGNVLNNATVVLEQHASGTFAGAISGSGELIKTGSGSLVLTGANSYSGGTVVRDGLLQGDSTSLQGDITNDALVFFDQHLSGEYAGAMSGEGGLGKTGAGILVLSGGSSYRGGTLVAGGTLQGDARSLQGAIEVGSGAALVFDQDADSVFGGTLSGTGTVTKRGDARLQVTGSHGFRGVTFVSAGALDLDGALAGSVNVGANATFSAAGVIGGSLTVHGSARIGTLGVGGDVTLHRGSQYGVTAEADGRSSMLATAGRASIDGATVAIDARPGTFGRVTHFGILQAAGGVTGTATVVSNVATLEPWLSQTGTQLFATVLRTDLPLEAFAATVNGANVGGAFDRLRATATGDLASVTRELTALDDAALSAALDSVAGEIHVSAIQLAALDGEGATALVRGELAERAFFTRHDAPSSTATGTGLGARWWTRAHGQQFAFDRTETAHGGDGHLRGLLLGVDDTFGDRWFAGGGGGYASGRLGADDGAEANGFSSLRAFGYIGYRNGRWATNAGGSAARTSYQTHRTMTFAALTPMGDALLFDGVDREATSAPTGMTVEAWGEERLEIDFGNWSLFPSAGLRLARYGRHEWDESGAGDLSVSGPAQAITSTEADAALWLGRTTGRFQPYVSGAYRRGLGDRTISTTLYLAERADGAFEVDGHTLFRSAFVGRVGLLFRTTNVGASISYELQDDRYQRRHMIQFSLGYN